MTLAVVEHFERSAQSGQIVVQGGVALQSLFQALALRGVQGVEQVAEQIVAGGISHGERSAIESRLR